jgi:predicted polyphosphate/ATP-dependent NAD kinase
MAPIGFIVNRIAGMGGRVGLKGADDTVEEARRRGAEPVAHARARAMLCKRNFGQDLQRPDAGNTLCP